MKEEQIKSLFFAQYLGKPVVYRDCSPLTLTGVIIDNLRIKADSGEIIAIRANDIVLSGDFSGIGHLQTGTASVNQCHSLLRSVGQLTDEEVLQTAKMCAVQVAYIDKELPIERVDGQINVRYWMACGEYGDDSDIYHFTISTVNCDCYDYMGGLHSGCGVRVVDYWRSLGLLLPFTYLSETNTPITLSPSELISKGWVRIINQ